jgi:hypothetical protein
MHSGSLLHFVLHQTLHQRWAASAVALEVPRPRWSPASIRAIAGAASGRSVGFGACLTIEAVSLPCF